MSIASQARARWELFKGDKYQCDDREDWDRQMKQAFESMQKDLDVDESVTEVMAEIASQITDRTYDVAGSPFLAPKQVSVAVMNGAFIGFVIALDIGKNTDAVITAFKATDAYKAAQSSIDAEQPSDRERREHRSGHKG